MLSSARLTSGLTRPSVFQRRQSDTKFSTSALAASDFFDNIKKFWDGGGPDENEQEKKNFGEEGSDFDPSRIVTIPGTGSSDILC